MLVPDNIHPEQTIYFNSAYVLKTLQEQGIADFFDLYEKTVTLKKMSMPVFVLCLDWLFLLNLVELNQDGMVKLCI
ncbi:MAG: hypothetical protein H3C47_00685 [Candidatus Cloacimonetes bacterium]|nr:hypothetical protein [Candidatus Cloacimonadota bacterium]